MIIPEVSEAIFQCLVDDFMSQPTGEDWLEIAEGFRLRWNFPNCLGSIDGKHVVIRASPNSGSWFYNYKGTFSIVLLAVVDAHYCFQVIDVGGYGRNSDGGTLSNSRFGEGLIDGTLDFPEDAVIPGAEHRGRMPFVLVGDEAFPLHRHLLHPFPGHNISRKKRIYNYRLSRARLTVENSFGILSSQWRMYRRVVELDPDKVEHCVKDTCVLHNFLCMSSMRPRAATQQLAVQVPVHRNPSSETREALRVRDVYSLYFNEEGAVPW